MRIKLHSPGWMRQLTRLWSNIGLGSKMTLIVVTVTVSLIGLFAYLGTVALSENIQRTLQERVVLAQMTARHVDYVLANIRNGLTDSAARETWSDATRVAPALERAYRQLDFSATQVFLLDRTAQSIAAYPPISATVSFSDFAAVAAVLDGQPFAVSRYARPLSPPAPSTIAAAPVLGSDGQVRGALVMTINFANPHFRTFTYPIGLGTTGYMDLIDRRGLILASTRPERVGMDSDHGNTLGQMIGDHGTLVSTCHDCHTETTAPGPQAQVLAFAPLEQAQWGITVRQNEAEVLASIHQLQERIFLLMILIVASDLIFIYLATRSIIVPVQALTAGTRRIAAGDLDTPITTFGRDEISTLARSFDAMRARVRDSMEEIQHWNRDLDARVQEGTAAYRLACQQREQLRSELLRRVIAAQEEERKRISRELHDETCQLLTGLAYALDNAEAKSLPETQPLFEQMHALTRNTLSGVHRIIFDLRPTMLDNLGLVPALRWFAETRLQGQGIAFTLRETSTQHRLPPVVETAVFRVVQEAINNIELHSRAHHAELVFDAKESWAEIRIDDDGIGFDATSLTGAPDGKRGLGLMGMEERMSAIGGEFHLCSAPGGGTRICLLAPMGAGARAEDVEGDPHG